MPNLKKFFKNAFRHGESSSKLENDSSTSKAHPSSPEEGFNISEIKLELRLKIGEGRFGEVWKGILQESKEVAIRKLRLQALESEEIIKQEVDLMKNLHHESVVETYAMTRSEEITCIAMEYISGGSLLDYLRYGAGNICDSSEYIHFVKQISCGMEYLESENFVHEDLHAANILMEDENRVCKITDHGLVHIFDDVQFLPRHPIKWVAPEAICGVFTLRSDVWSFGILMWEIYSKGRIPYPAVVSSSLLDMIDRGYRMSCPTNCPESLYKIMLRCWNENSHDRPTFEYLKECLATFDSGQDASENVKELKNEDL